MPINNVLDDMINRIDNNINTHHTIENLKGGNDLQEAE